MLSSATFPTPVVPTLSATAASRITTPVTLPITAGTANEAFCSEQLVDHDQDLPGQLVLLQPVAKAHDSGLVRRAGKLLQLGELSVYRHVKDASSMAGSDRLNHCCIKMHAQHGLQCKRRPAAFTLGVVGGRKAVPAKPREPCTPSRPRTGACGSSCTAARASKRLVSCSLFYNGEKFPTTKILEFCRASLKLFLGLKYNSTELDFCLR